MSSTLKEVRQPYIITFIFAAIKSEWHLSNEFVKTGFYMKFDSFLYVMWKVTHTRIRDVKISKVQLKKNWIILSWY
jgi:hypothetical protein